MITIFGKAVLCLTTLHFYSVSAQVDCYDLNGKQYTHGYHYVPGPEICKLCICNDGQPINCKMMICAPPDPEDCPSYHLGPSCCEYICSISDNDNEVEKPEDKPEANEHAEPGSAAAFILSHAVPPTNGAEVLLLTLGY